MSLQSSISEHNSAKPNQKGMMISHPRPHLPCNKIPDKVCQSIYYRFHKLSKKWMVSYRFHKLSKKWMVSEAVDNNIANNILAICNNHSTIVDLAFSL
ncbi:hypothetical protein GOBAR_AA34491 [Gossypium barbadense]|uniref:Uncharacterized protein n=1 Tax=Gossypium barbadense TaxID=3634 RepID=A0A2P5W553_GOSBA|nr:hypothetical protein GOBAR_AA34491 [Gossypium barbadense]